MPEGINFIPMEFEFDPDKNLANREKHGISFEDAQALWEDEDRLQIPAISETEERFALLASFRTKVWAAFFIYRGNAIRLISFRRARTNEVELYESGRTG